jgi:hypothetical protein
MTTARRGGLAALVLVLVALEFTNAPPHVWYSAHVPPWVAAVRKLPARATVVQYPVVPAFSPRSLYYMFWQTKERRADTNPSVSPEAVALAAQIGSPDDPAAGAALRRAGIDYAIVHTRLPPQTTVPYQPELPDDSMPRDAGALNPWFQEVARTPDAVIYRLRPAPVVSSGAVARAGDGFGGIEPEGSSSARWLLQDPGHLDLFVTGGSRRIDLVLTLSSFDRSRQVTIALGRRRLTGFAVPSGAYVTRRVAVGTLAPGRYSLSVSTRPGPQSIQATTGSPDSRSVSIRLREPIVIRASR